jgi:hypothetical protein
MAACAYCHGNIHPASRFCSVCGQAVPSASGTHAHPLTAFPPYHPHASHGRFGQHFGLDPRITLLTIAVDSMLFGGQLVTLGSTALLSIPAGIVLGFITYRAQRHWYRDDRESAMIKALIVGLLTAIPTSLPGFLTIPSGIVGLAHLISGKRRADSLA